MLRIRTGGILNIDGRTATSDRPIIVRHNRKRGARFAASVVRAPSGSTTVTLPTTITGLDVTNTTVFFNVRSQQWTVPELPLFAIHLHDARLYDLPDFLALVVEVHCDCARSSIEATVTRRRSQQYMIDLRTCTAGRIMGLESRRQRKPPSDSAAVVDVTTTVAQRAATPPPLASPPLMSPPPMRGQYATLTQLMLETNATQLEIQAARDQQPELFAGVPPVRIFSNVSEMFIYFLEMSDMEAVTDEDAPDPVRCARDALKDHVSRLTLLASLRPLPSGKDSEHGFLYAEEADLAAWLREKRPQLACRLGTHQLTDVVLEATAELAIIEIVHRRRPTPEPVADSAAACAICCEFPPSSNICRRCTDGTVCAGCLDRLVLETANPCCPFCRGALQRPATA